MVPKPITALLFKALTFSMEPVTSTTSNPTQTSSSSLCTGCNPLQFKIIQQCFENNAAAIDIFTKHGVIKDKNSQICPKCNNKLVYRPDQHIFYCTHTFFLAKTKKRRKCGYSDDDIEFDPDDDPAPQ